MEEAGGKTLVTPGAKYEQMGKIPFFAGYDPESKKLTLRGATHFPPEVLDFADSIEILDASNCGLSALPQDFGRLRNLKVAFFSNNLFEEIPEVLSQCSNLSMLAFKSCKIARFPENALPPSIRWLMLTDNLLTELPASIGALTHLQKLALAGNRLSSLPDEMAACRELELLRISANNFTSPPPDWLFSLPRLAWYGDAGNPFSAKSAVEQTPLSEISWNEIALGRMINESPSTTVYEATVTATDERVAVKIFKTGLASDGYPADDMHASIAAGEHENLIRIIGQLTQTPDDKHGLVLSLVPSTYTKLGLPPNFDTCTRDTFPESVSFSLPYVRNVLRGVASAGRHLHGHGLAHGDLYAHNTLSNAEGHSLLGDFGAASLYDPSSGKARERLDVRAFGCLMDDLLSRCEKGSPTEDIAKLRSLQDACMNASVSERPLFSEICEALK